MLCIFEGSYRETISCIFDFASFTSTNVSAVRPSSRFCSSAFAATPLIMSSLHNLAPPQHYQHQPRIGAHFDFKENALYKDSPDPGLDETVCTFSVFV